MRAGAGGCLWPCSAEREAQIAVAMEEAKVELLNQSGAQGARAVCLGTKYHKGRLRRLFGS